MRYPQVKPKVVYTVWISHDLYACVLLQSRYPGGRGNTQRLLLIWWVSSWIWLKASRSLFIRLDILEVACITVEWSRPPKAFPILGRDSSVSSRERYMATCRGYANPFERLWPT